MVAHSPVLPMIHEETIVADERSEMQDLLSEEESSCVA
jgi:hypothetical protein